MGVERERFAARPCPRSRHGTGQADAFVISMPMPLDTKSRRDLPCLRDSLFIHHSPGLRRATLQHQQQQQHEQQQQPFWLCLFPCDRRLCRGDPAARPKRARSVSLPGFRRQRGQKSLARARHEGSRSEQPAPAPGPLCDGPANERAFAAVAAAAGARNVSRPAANTPSASSATSPSRLQPSSRPRLGVHRRLHLRDA